MKRVAFCTLGCKVNAYDSASMQTLFLQSGYEVVPFGQDADIVVVNTCTVTAVADKKSRASIRRAALHGQVIVVGCLAQRAAKQLLEMDGVGAVIGTDDRARIVETAERLLGGDSAIDLTHNLKGCSYEPLRTPSTGARTRGVLKIQEGCNCFCSYCIIPYVRGRSRSRDFQDVLTEARLLANDGVKEIVLTGIHIASYKDEDKNLGDLVEALAELKGTRVRLGSLEPGVLGERFVSKAAAAENFCPHFHLSLQSGSASVLERMNRPYTPEQYMEFVEMLRRSFYQPAITTDLIAGFPGETDDEHAQTLAFVKDMAFARLHVFPYSPREGTRAFDLKPRITKAVAKARAAELTKLGDELEKAFILSRLGKKATVLFEEPSAVFDGCMEGYCERYIRVGSKAQQNEIKTVTLSKLSGKTAFGIEEGI